MSTLALRTPPGRSASARSAGSASSVPTSFPSRRPRPTRHGADAAGGQLSSAGSSIPRAASDLCVELRRQHHVDIGQPDAYVHHARPLSGPAHGIRRRNSAISAPLSISVGSRPTATILSLTDGCSRRVTSSPSAGQRNRRGGRHAARERIPGRSTSCTKGISILALPSPVDERHLHDPDHGA